MSEPKFKRGDRVFKRGGRYGGPGIVIGETEPDAVGYRLYNVAMGVAGGYGYFVHVFPERCLEHATGLIFVNQETAFITIEAMFACTVDPLPSPPEQ